MKRARIWPRCVRDGCDSPQLGFHAFCAWHWRMAKMVCPGEVNDLLLSSDDTPTTVIEERILAIRAQLEKS